MSALPFDQRDGYIWLDGEMVEWKSAHIHVLSHGLHYGGSVFEGVRAYSGNIFKLEEHTTRFFRSAKLIDMEITDYSADEINQACKDVLSKNNISDGYLRPVAWRGPEEMGIGSKNCKTHVAIAAWEWPSYFPPEVLEKGISLKTATWRRPSGETMPVESKAGCLYAIGTMAKHEASKAGFTDALMLDYRGYVAEATGANIFVIKNGKIATPIPDASLNGITRQTVMQLAKDHGYEMIERVIMPEELADADEIFLTGTAAEITAVGQIDGNTYKVGDVTRTLRSAYEKLVGKA